MAQYGNQQRGSYGSNRPTQAAPAARSFSSEKKAESTNVIYSTGVFKPKKVDSKALASVQLKEAVTLAAGDRIILLANDTSRPTKTGKEGPSHTIMFVKGDAEQK